jgi:hypothetical protein
MLVGTICACAMGTSMPLFTLFWGKMTNSFAEKDRMVDTAREVMYNFLEIGLASFFAGWGMYTCWMITG